MLIEENLELKSIDPLSNTIIGSAIKIHRVLGPGLLESCYEASLAYELSKQGLMVERQKSMPFIYEEVRLDCGYRIDLMVENKIVIEVKSINELAPIHKSQLLCYLKLSGCKLGLLMNFNVRKMKDGIRRLIL